MSIDMLHAAVADRDRLKSEMDALTLEQVRIEPLLSRTKSELTQAEDQLEKAGIAFVRIGTPVDPSLSERVRELKANARMYAAALAEIHQQLEEIGPRFKAAQEAAKRARAPVAAELAGAQLDKVHELAQQLAVHLIIWGELDAAASGSWMSGQVQTKHHRLVELLRKHGIHVADGEIAIAGRGPVHSPEYILGAAQQILARSESQAVDS